mgnify:CR=1 FL=1
MDASNNTYLNIVALFEKHMDWFVDLQFKLAINFLGFMVLNQIGLTELI